MKTATVTDFRQNLKDYLSEIQKDQDFLILSGPKKMDFVVLTLEAFNTMEETAHLLSSPKNTSRLMESIAQDKAGKVVTKMLDFADKEPSRRKTRTHGKATSKKRHRVGRSK